MNWLNKRVNVFENAGVVIHQWTSRDGDERVVVEFEINNDTKKIAWFPEDMPISLRGRRIRFKPNHRYCIATVGAYYFSEAVTQELDIE